MKLQHVLSYMNQIEKSKFINFLEKVCSSNDAIKDGANKALDKSSGQIKSASGSEITQLFKNVSVEYKKTIREQLELSGAAMGLLVNILTRDGNCVARTTWIEQLYAQECDLLDKMSQELLSEINTATTLTFDRPDRLRIYNECLKVAYFNDLKSNRQPQITDDERSILNVLAKNLKVSNDEATAIEHLSNPIQCGQETVNDCLQKLREIGVLFINRKNAEVVVPDEVVSILNEIQKKEISDKHVLRILRTLSDPELSTILKNYGKKVRGVERVDKIRSILHSGNSVRELLSNDLYDKEESQNKRKERLKNLISDLAIESDRIGSTVEERISLIFDHLNEATEHEFNAVSAASYKEMFSSIGDHFSGKDLKGDAEILEDRLKREFELEENEQIDVEKLKMLSITPHDVLYLLSNDEIKVICDSMGLSKRGNMRLNVIDAFANANDKLIENYVALSKRDLASLKSSGIEINEADIGVKFEEVTKAIFERLDLNVDEDLRKSISTAKDKADILISVSDSDVIIGEAKTFKNGHFAKYSTTSRQVKSYVTRCENHGKRVSQVLIIAPAFSSDFIESAEMDTEVNISLLTAEGLKLIHDAYCAKKKPNFSPKLLTKGGLLKAELIAKNI